MKYINNWFFVLLLAGFLLSACIGQIPVTSEKVAPSKLEPIEGSEISKVVITEKAAERLGIETVLISGSEIPYAAVIYDTEGKTWIYTNPDPLTYVRAPIMIDYIEGDTAFLSESLVAELTVVTVGVMELYGTETGVSK